MTEPPRPMNPLNSPLGNAVATALWRASGDAGALYLDPADEFAQEPNWLTTLYLDDIGGHLSPAGNRFLADYVSKHVFVNRSATH